MAGRIRAHDWSSTPLGARESWSDRLTLMVEQVLANPLVATLACGPAHVLIYNDAASRLYGDRHPSALGRPLPDSFPEGWATVAPYYARALAGETVRVVGQPLDTRGEGAATEVFDALLVPVREADGRVAHVHMTGIEIAGGLRSEVRRRESEALLAAAFESVPAGVAAIDTGGRVVLANAEFRRFLPTGVIPSRDPERGSRWRAWTGQGDRLDPCDYPGARALRGERAIPGQDMLYTDDDGREIWTNVVAVPTFGRAGQVNGLVSVISDIDERKRSAEALRQGEAWLVGQKEAFQAAMNGAPLEASLDILIRTAIEQAGDGRRCAFYIADLEGKALRHVVGMPEAYALCVDDFAISPESLACGLAVARGEPVITPDVADEPRWAPWLRMARDVDDRGCWSFPVETTAGKLVGSFAMYFREPRQPTRRDRDMAAALTQTAAIIISHHHETEERAQAEQALRASEERLIGFGEASSDVLWIRHAETLQWVYLTPAFEAIYGLGREAALRGDNMAGWLNLILPEDREHALANIRRVLGGERVDFEYRIRRPGDGAVRRLRNTDFPMRDATGAVRWLGGVGRDITEERETAERMEVLVAELQHRTRNLLGVVKSLFQETMRRSDTLATFNERFGERLDALARVNALLARSGQPGITIGELVHAALDALGGGTIGERIRLEGPEVKLRSSVVQTLALALHELATNARKYGALATERGRLAVTWSVREAEEGARLVVDWTERGGPPLESRTEPGGYGRELIEQALPYALKARTHYTLGETGVHCSIDLPLAKVPIAKMSLAERPPREGGRS
ncbi:PAS domain-containing sensor histidine kinase [Methylobacterium tarhaniae]|uniref:PAS domain-containing sensor histidine kinase n=1 Tax=Methylobacterium tarhaniae TaxID=1187852 RepID=UPI00069DF5B6|nr:PAS domain S-box protein [Methylobacterium tarhaniae]